jgi:hypothetical protein
MTNSNWLRYVQFEEGVLAESVAESEGHPSAGAW